MINKLTVTMPDNGESYTIPSLFARPSANTKLAKSQKEGYRVIGISMSPHKMGGGNVCPHASPGCIASCLNTAGYGAYSNTQRGRLAKHIAFMTQRDKFIETVHQEIYFQNRTAKRYGQKLAVRLNVFSDIPWEKVAPQLFKDFPDVIYYDYDKNPKRMGNTPDNYHLTFSRSETNYEDCIRILGEGHNVAVVFSSQYARSWGNSFPDRFFGTKKIIDGDVTDLRFLDPKGGYVIALRAKGRARHDTTGFVVAVA